ncbi:MAG: hypothetical protein KDI55_19970 [Anaerolineae bacterium]|nr:hypothetical protein [Anaerolineae bacterium]
MEVNDYLITAIGALGAAVVGLAGAVVKLWAQENKHRLACDARLERLNDMVRQLMASSCDIRDCASRRLVDVRFRRETDGNGQ